MFIYKAPTASTFLKRGMPKPLQISPDTTITQ